jgi:hypothetical protein
MDSTLIQNLFAPYNVEDSLLPFYLPLFGWILTFIYCQLTNKSFESWAPVHNAHHLVGMTLATLSLYYDDESILAERIGIMWSLSYFLVDLVDQVRHKSVSYSVHAVCVLFLGMSNLYTPRFYRLRMNSKAMFLELSTPILYLSKHTRKPLHFVLFAVTFTLCRIIWIPFMMHQLLDDGMPWKDPRLLVLVVFYGLNWFWYSKILRLLVFPPDEKKKKKKKKEDDEKKD